MTLRKLVPPLLKSGTKLRDQAITLAGTRAFLRPVVQSTTGRYGVKKTEVYGSKKEIFLIPEWPDERLLLDIMNLSQEEDVAIEAKSRMKDKISAGDIIEFDSFDENGSSITQTYKVVRASVKAMPHYYSKSIKFVPHRTESF